MCNCRACLPSESCAPRSFHHDGAILSFGPAVRLGRFDPWVTDMPFLALFVVGRRGCLALASAGFVWFPCARLRGRGGVASLCRRKSRASPRGKAWCERGSGSRTSALLLRCEPGDLIADWRESLPKAAPNYFFVNIPSEDRPAFEAYITEAGGRLSRVLPMIRGRMTHINDQSMQERAFGSPRGEGFAQREQNLTWAAEIGPDNQITEGK